ncbi:MAG: rRNA cytosine-C5-methyltransferase, partial [Paramuribaculum sp.]
MLLPEGFMARFEGLGVPALDALPQALAEEPSVSVRYNRLKHSLPPDGADTVPWCPEGCYLPSRPQFTLDPALHQGLYYVQDASSMFIAHAVRHLTASGQPVRYLDACAAPGGKTTAALSALPPGSLVVANEYVPSRAAILRENLVKWGAPAVVTQGDVSRFAADGASFHIIAADVPCSG